jgi:hypothetical protein
MKDRANQTSPFPCADEKINRTQTLIFPSFQVFFSGQRHQNVSFQVKVQANVDFLDFRELFSLSEILSPVLEQKQLLFEDEKLVIVPVLSDDVIPNTQTFTVDCVLRETVRDSSDHHPSFAHGIGLLRPPLCINVDERSRCKVQQQCTFKNQYRKNKDRWISSFFDSSWKKNSQIGNSIGSSISLHTLHLRCTGFLLSRIHARNQKQIQDDVVDLLRGFICSAERH